MARVDVSDLALLRLTGSDGDVYLATSDGVRLWKVDLCRVSVKEEYGSVSVADLGCVLTPVVKGREKSS